ncbi:hypothetical protein VI817_002052 [Penicillium citrinum]|nr:hypothetical protein VI817_002052 [Penicillium citrinum]
MSHSSRWESDHEDRYSRSPQTASDPHHHSLLSNHDIGGYFTQVWRPDDDESFATLEMPDGTTRRTSNWLPVDSSAGITIGTASRAQYDAFHMEGFHDMKSAFFVNPTR